MTKDFNRERIEGNSIKEFFYYDRSNYYQMKWLNEVSI